MENPVNPAVVEAEENLLIDFQFAIQEMMHEKNVNRTELAECAGISKARLSQILSNEANPTVKSMARLFHALGERACVSRKLLEEVKLAPRLEHISEWVWAKATIGEIRVDEQLVAVVKDTGASNDNYDDRFVMIESELDAAVA